ncbi:response regulator transcription factor, partial [Variovorax sp. E3]|uniref:response regulator transcription factor n=1 Tax=Variovorax sp. E3 TaxID=1914993 RepID=UPI0018DB449A
ALRAEGDAGRLDPQAVAALTGHARPVAAAAVASGESAALLSSREVEVLGRISLGESNKEAARTLGISPSTVRAHLENIFRKLGCTTRAAATLKALTLGLL